MLMFPNHFYRCTSETKSLQEMLASVFRDLDNYLLWSNKRKSLAIYLMLALNCNTLVTEAVIHFFPKMCPILECEMCELYNWTTFRAKNKIEIEKD